MISYIQLCGSNFIYKEESDMRKIKISKFITAAVLSAMLTGCSGNTAPDMEPIQTELDTISIPEQVQVAGLGEANHGVKEYQELKAEVFRTLVHNYGCRTFIIEGDFGNALKVDAYIHGGEGTSKEAAATIGFRIYRTREMADLLEWMRSYNETAPAGQDLHFYGMDMQQADNSKNYLFSILKQIDPELTAEYEKSFSFLNDDAIYDISTEVFAEGMPEAEKLLADVDRRKEQIVEVCGSEAFEFARECANSIYNCCDIRKSNSEYNEVRDRHMAEKVHWFLEHGDGSLLFINGHNGHIARVNTSLYDCMGRQLAEDLGDRYYTIGTDARITTFNSQTDNGFTETTAKNKNDLNALAGSIEGARYYIDLQEASFCDGWDKILSGTQRITSLNVGSLTLLKMFYTTKIIPCETFDGMIIFDQVGPTTVDL